VGLLGERREVPSIPENGRGAEDFLKNRELGGETGVDEMGIVLGTTGQQALALGMRAASDDYLQLRDQRESSFVEERDFRHEELGTGISLRLVLRLQTGMTHQGVENFFQEEA
jgi:hypothetical protein